MENEKVRVNRLWVAMIDSRTKENDEYINHTACMVKFEMPENEVTQNRSITNTKGNAIWFYLNHLDMWSTMSNDRMINAADLPEEIVNLIPYKQLAFRDGIATIKDYKKFGLCGYPKTA
jgi:hypothetical protein